MEVDVELGIFPRNQHALGFRSKVIARYPVSNGIDISLHNVSDRILNQKGRSLAACFLAVYQ